MILEINNNWIICGNRKIDLTPLESKIILALSYKRPEGVSFNDLFQIVYDTEETFSELPKKVQVSFMRNIGNRICILRKKGLRIKSLKQYGYKIESQVEVI